MPLPPSVTRTFRSILCPVDLSAGSRAAARTAAMMAGRFKARLTVVFVDDPLLSQAAARFDEDEIERRSQAELTRFVQKAIGPSPRCTCQIVSGDPAGEILKAARRLEADLIVMGTQGHRGPKRLFFGSTADAVLRRSAVPVLVVPPTTRK